MNASRLLLQSLGLLLLLLIGPGIALADSVPATVAYVQGDAYYLDSAGQSQKLTANMQIPAGCSITTGANGAVGLQLVPGATTVFGSNTDAKITSLKYTKSPSGQKKRSVLLSLNKGTIFSSLIKNDGNSDFRISTPEGVAAARGTDWSVTVSGSTVSVAVLDGNVNITLPDGSVISIPANNIGVSTSGTPGNITYVITGLTEDEKNEIINAIRAAGFRLSGGGVTNGINYSNKGQDSGNPANFSFTPGQSPN